MGRSRLFIDAHDIGRLNIARTQGHGGPPLLLLHPVGLDLSWWAPQFEAFGRERDVIAFDMPGHGLSDAPPSPPSFEMMARAVEVVLEELGGRPADVVGVSVGGMIAQTFALRRPDLVRSLGLVATLCTFAPEVRQALRERARVAREEGMPRIAELSNERWFTPAFRARRPDMIERTRRSLLQQSATFHAAMWEMIADLELEAAIRAIRCPSLVLTGEADVNAPPTAAEKIASAVANASLHLMPDVGHFPPFEAPEAFNDILRAFLDDIEAQAA